MNHLEYKDSMFKTQLSVYKDLTKRKIMCEFLGTFTFVYFANWSYISFRVNEQSEASYGLSVGLLLMILIWMGAGTSGAIYNPA
jgi:glycerol uptake facilitator-like aquaporin